jgi:hypothetical protein
MQHVTGRKFCCGPVRTGSVGRDRARDLAISPVADISPPIAVILIDTLPIRIAPKLFHCIADVHSNRHSPEALNTRSFWPGIESCGK